MNKKTFVATLLVVISLLSGCSTYKANDNDADAAQSTGKYEFMDVRIAKADESYTVYGFFEDIHTLIGNDEVVVASIKPVDKGGVECDNDQCPRTAAFASTKLFEDIGMETYFDVNGMRYWKTLSTTKPRYWKLTMAKSVCGRLIVSAEEVNVDDIPEWLGA